MSPEVERIFDELVDLDGAARDRYFADHSIPPQLRHEIESLLAHDRSSATLLMDPILKLAASAVPALPRCGAYELKELIGRGGMGAVYRAERADGEIRRQVAVKLMQTGSSDPSQRQRFLQERQILAGLQHPNIATLLDAGHADNGQPYFVLELVHGKRIDEFCEGLTVRQKIELFFKVCDAVAFAHSRLVVHRDLKPGNILVTAEGVPKLLDFGIAKLLDNSGDETMTWARAMTPSYGSPEQVTGSAVTTATDVYSLGAVLFRLLTGRSPHALEETTPEAIINAICLRDVTRPSKANPELAGDLDAILMKALRKEPEQRYQTVEQFSDDLQSYLQLRPIRVRQGEFFYRLSKYTRRYWLPLTAAFVAIVALSVAFLTASRERQLAERRFSTARALASNLFEVENRVRSLNGSTDARQYIADTALKYLNQLSGQANERDLLLELGEAYGRTAAILSSRRDSSLGRDADALAALNRGDQLLRKALAANPNDHPALRLLVRNRTETLLLLTDKGQRSALESLVADLGQLTDSLCKHHPEPADLNLASISYAGIRRALTTVHSVHEAGRYAQLAVDYSRRYAESAHSPDALLQYSRTLRSYGNFLRLSGELQQSLAALQQARQTLDQIPDSKSKQRELSAILYYIGIVNGDVLGLADRSAAISALQRSSDIARQLMIEDAKDHNVRIDFVQSHNDLAQIVQDTQPARALRLYDEAWNVIQAEPVGSFLRAEYMVRLTAESTFALRKLGRPAEAAERLKRITDMFPDLAKSASNSTARLSESDEALLRAQAEMDAAAGRSNQAIAAYRLLLQRLTASSSFRPRESVIDALALSEKEARLTSLLTQIAHQPAAQEYATQRLELWKYWNQQLPNNPFVAQQLAAASK